jgi:hypothetical protein
VRGLLDPHPKMNNESAANGQSNQPKPGQRPAAFITEPWVCALAGLSKVAARRALRHLGPPINVQFAGKVYPGWQFEELPFLIQAAIADTVQKLFLRIGPPPGLTPERPSEDRRRTKKNRSDAILSNLPESSKQLVCRWLSEEGISYASARARIKLEFGVSTSMTSLSKFYNDFCAFPLKQSDPLHHGGGSLRIDFLSSGPKLTVLNPGDES